MDRLPIDPTPAVDLAAPGLALAWHVDDNTADLAMLHLWYRLRDQWLSMVAASPHTRRSYTLATAQWLDYIANHGLLPWRVTPRHVRAWQDWLLASGRTPGTIAQRLAACSSWYAFVIEEVHIVDGIERSAFADASGHTRANPFRAGNLRRPHITPYGKAQPMPAADLNTLFAHLQVHAGTIAGSRNYALLLTHLLTACRSSEIVRLRWGDIRPSRSQDGVFVFAWTGKRAKAEDAVLPARAYHAIVSHLRIAGRWLPGHPASIQDRDPIFIPLVTHGQPNLRHSRVKSGESGAPPAPQPGSANISPRSVQRILKTSLRRAGVSGWQTYRVHDLRHSFAHLHYSHFRDLESLRRLLHHDSITTTGIYIRQMEDPVDTHSDLICQTLGI